MRRRPAARLLVVDPQQRLLLLRFNHKVGPLAGQVYWATPGGGLEPGETFAAAASRELAEETGIVGHTLGPVVHQRRFPLQLPDGDWVEAIEKFFLVSVDDGSLDFGLRSSYEVAVSDMHRWWGVGELRSASEPVYPENLADLLEAHLAARNSTTL